jgi:hypothetical protein
MENVGAYVRVARGEAVRGGWKVRVELRGSWGLPQAATSALTGHGVHLARLPHRAYAILGGR